MSKIAQKLRIKRPNIVSAEAQPQTPLGNLQCSPGSPRHPSRLGVVWKIGQTSTTVSTVTLRPDSSVSCLEKWIATVLDTMR